MTDMAGFLVGEFLFLKDFQHAVTIAEQGEVVGSAELFLKECLS